MSRSSFILTTLSATALSLLPASSAAVGQQATRLDRLEDSSLGSVTESAWSLRAVADERLPSARIEVVDAARALVLIADRAAGQAWLELDESIDPNGGTLSWEWSIGERPRGGALRVPDTDDSAGRFFVVFGGGGLFRRPRVLFYSWGHQEEIGDTFASHVDDRLGVIVVRNAADSSNVWYRERRDAAADFRQVFGREPDEIRAVGLMVDTDQLDGRAEVRLRRIEWVSN